MTHIENKILRLADQENENLALFATRWWESKKHNNGAQDPITKLRKVKKFSIFSYIGFIIWVSCIVFSAGRAFTTDGLGVSLIVGLLLGSLIDWIFSCEEKKIRAGDLTEFLDIMKILEKPSSHWHDTELPVITARVTDQLNKEAARVKKLQSMPWKKAEADVTRKWFVGVVANCHCVFETSDRVEDFFEAKFSVEPPSASVPGSEASATPVLAQN